MSKTAERRRANPGSSRRAGVREQEILEAATAVFAEKGYTDTSMHDIGERVGILGGSVYYYFKSKEELLYKILSQLNVRALEHAEAIEEKGGAPSQRLRGLVRGHLITLDLMTTHLFFQAFRYLSGNRAIEIGMYRDRYRDYIADVIGEGQATGEFASDVDPKVSAIGILTMLNGVPLWYVPSGLLTLEDVSNTFEAMIFDGLAAR